MRALLHLPSMTRLMAMDIAGIFLQADVRVTLAETVEQFSAAFQADNGHFPYVVVDQSCGDLVSLLDQQNESVWAAVLMVDGLGSLDSRFLNSPSFMHFLAPSFMHSKEDFVSLILSLRRQQGMASEFFLRAGAPTYRFRIGNAEEKSTALDNLRHFVNKGSIRPGDPKTTLLGVRIVTIADELILHGIFSANPHLQSVNSLGEGLRQCEPVELTWVYDGRFFAITVSDQVGIIQRARMATVLNRNTELMVADTERNAPNVGLRYVFERTHKLIFSSIKGICSEVTAIVEMDKRVGSKKATPSSLMFHVLARSC